MYSGGSSPPPVAVKSVRLSCFATNCRYVSVYSWPWFTCGVSGPHVVLKSLALMPRPHGSLMWTKVPSGVPSPLRPLTTRMCAPGIHEVTQNGPKSSSIDLNLATENDCGGSATNPKFCRKPPRDAAPSPLWYCCQ